MKGEGGKDVGDEPDRKIASKLGRDIYNLFNTPL